MPMASLSRGVVRCPLALSLAVADNDPALSPVRSPTEEGCIADHAQSCRPGRLMQLGLEFSWAFASSRELAGRREAALQMLTRCLVFQGRRNSGLALRSPGRSRPAEKSPITLFQPPTTCHLFRFLLPSPFLPQTHL